MDATISGQTSSLTPLNHPIYSSGRTESSITACRGTSVASLDRTDEVKVTSLYVCIG